ncbi:MAG: histidine phosphatase family protein, partial [bacterium]|nr:histidine phosphatase family protein [bacterium]
MELYLIRHGQSFNNALKDSSQRVCDPPLTEIGVAQAERAGEYLKAASAAPGSLEVAADVQNKTGYVFTRIFCSAMLRTLQTTLPIARALDMRPEIWLDVHEEGGIWRDAGDGQGPIGYSGLVRGEIEAQFPGFVIPDEITEKGWWNRPAETKEEWTVR